MRVFIQALFGLRSGYCLQDIAEKFDSSPYSEHSFALTMAAYIGGHHLQLKEQL